MMDGENDGNGIDVEILGIAKISCWFTMCPLARRVARLDAR